MTTTKKNVRMLATACDRLRADNEQLRVALQRFVDASDQFVRDTGLKHGDLITDASEYARAVLKAKSLQS